MFFISQQLALFVLRIIENTKRKCDFNITVVSACFPSSQSFLEVKLKECEIAVEQGADEVDIVLSLSKFLAGDLEGAAEEIRQVRAAIDNVAQAQGRKVHLKVILETGLLRTPENIANASFLAMEAGADFIKTSTGKVDINATPVGTAPNIEDAPALDYSALGESHQLFDLVYNPANTEFLKRGEAQGANTMNGILMLQTQAIASWHIWQRELNIE